jgi:hypothetical protein
MPINEQPICRLVWPRTCSIQGRPDALDPGEYADCTGEYEDFLLIAGVEARDSPRDRLGGRNSESGNFRRDWELFRAILP